MSTALTESELQHWFCVWLKCPSQRSHVPVLHDIACEVPAPLGIPDVIGVSLRHPCSSDELSQQTLPLTSPSSPVDQIWAFELKLHAWDVAFFQASRNLDFATHSVAVFPEKARSLLDRYSYTYRRAGVGIAFFDHIRMRLTMPIRPRQSRRLRLSSQIVVLSRLDMVSQSGTLGNES